MKTKLIIFRFRKLLVSLLGLSIALTGLTQDTSDEDIYELSPFEVTTDGDLGYLATSTLAGSRIQTDLRDLGSAIQVVTEEFMEDTGATNVKDILVYTTNTEVGGIGGNFSGTNTGGGQTQDGSTRNNPSRNTRVRGLNSADLTRDFFITDIPMDAYNTSRVDIQRGPNSILFGLGSPAGIINNSLKQPTMGEGGTELGLRMGRWGTFRSTLDIDKTLINNTLGIRVIGLHEDQKYRQDPAFEEDQRLYVSGRWTPKLFKKGRTTIKLSYENGEIDANRPRTTPPKDLISPWYDSNILNKQPFNPLTDSRNDTYHGWLGRWFENVVGAVYSDHASSALGGFGLPEFYSSGNGQGIQMEGVAQQRLSTNSPSHYWNVREGRNLAGFWKDQQMTDSSIFDFRNNLLDGPNKREWNDFDALNFNIAQTFFDDMFGIEFVYDEQSVERGNTGIISGAAYGIEIDFNTNLPDGRVNPNFGRPFVASDGQDGGLSFLDRETYRGTAFFNLDFRDLMDDSGWFSKLMGHHTFTGNYSDSELINEYRGFQNWVLGPEIGVLGNIDHAQNIYKGASIHYLGSAIDHMSSPSGAHIPGIKAVQAPGSGNALLWAEGDWQTIPMTTLNYKDNLDQLYDWAEITKDQVESQVLVWQGWFLNDTVVPLVAWRKDEASSFSSPNGTAPRSDFNNLFLPDDPSWVLPEEADNMAEQDGTTWGVVFHSPDFINQHLPYGTRISLSYNESSNWRPAAGRKNFYGEPHPFPSGETKDYGVTISTLEDKLFIRMNWYETSQNYDSVRIANQWFAGNIQLHSLMYAIQRPTASADIINEWFGLTGVDTGDPLTSALPRRAAWGEGEIFNLTDEELAFRREWFAARGEAEWFTKFDPKLVETWNFRKNPNSGDNPVGFLATSPSGMTSLVDTVSEGFELEIVYNPTKNWRISLNAAKAEATQSNKGADLDEFIAANSPFWLDGWDRNNPPVSPETIDGFGDMPIWNNRFTRTITSEALSRVLIPYWTAKNEDGRFVQEMREWSANLITNYSFSDGALKGFNLGGAIRYQDGVAIGNAVIEDPEVGLIYDVNDSFMGPSETTFDLWMGYSRKLGNDIDWKIQLNVSNLFGSDALIPITAQPNGEYASFRIPNPNVWWITNTFKF